MTILWPRSNCCNRWPLIGCLTRMLSWFMTGLRQFWLHGNKGGNGQNFFLTTMASRAFLSISILALLVMDAPSAAGKLVTQSSGSCGLPPVPFPLSNSLPVFHTVAGFDVNASWLCEVRRCRQSLIYNIIYYLYSRGRQLAAILVSGAAVRGISETQVRPQHACTHESK